MKKLPLIITLLFFSISSLVLAVDKTPAASLPVDEPVILINAFIVPAGKEEESIVFWEKAANFMRTQPGYILTILHQTILPNAKFELINVAKWRSAQDYKNASHASHALKTQSGIKLIDGLILNPSLYKVIRSD